MSLAFQRSPCCPGYMRFSERTRDKFRRVAASYQIPLAAFEAAIESVAPDIIADNHREVASAGGKARLQGMTPLERRARHVPPKEPDPMYRARVARALARFERLEAAGKCQVLYGDESGFCLQPCLPYLWQKVGEPTIGLPTQAHGQRLSVLGLLCPKDGRLWHFCTQGKLTADTVIACLESWLPSLSVQTILVLDNAPIHRAKAVQEKRKVWRKRSLRLLYLPPYSPHLNRIKVVWRQVKYRWLAPDAYRSFERLCQAVNNVLGQVGSKYNITFA